MAAPLSPHGDAAEALAAAYQLLIEIARRPRDNAPPDPTTLQPDDEADPAAA